MVNSTDCSVRAVVRVGCVAAIGRDVAGGGRRRYVVVGGGTRRGKEEMEISF